MIEGALLGATEVGAGVLIIVVNLKCHMMTKCMKSSSKVGAGLVETGLGAEVVVEVTGARAKVNRIIRVMRKEALAMLIQPLAWILVSLQLVTEGHLDRQGGEAGLEGRKRAREKVHASTQTVGL